MGRGYRDHEYLLLEAQRATATRHHRSSRMTGPAPVPLTGAEWAAVQKADAPKMRAILGEELGVLSSFARLDPSNRDILANIFVTDKNDGVEMSLNFGIQDRNPASTRAKRMQAPPTAVSIGVRKFWSVFEEELCWIMPRLPLLRPNPC